MIENWWPRVATDVADLSVQRDREYEPPALRPLGTLAELTRGGTAGPDDGVGGAGSAGSLP